MRYLLVDALSARENGDDPISTFDTLEDVSRFLTDRAQDYTNDYSRDGWRDELQLFLIDSEISINVESTVRVSFEDAIVVIPEPELPMQDMVAVLALLERRNPEDHTGHHSYVNGTVVRALADVPNDFYKDRLPFIPAGTEIKLDFGGDFGVYGMAQVGPVLHRVKVETHDLHRIDWRPLL